ncbi:PE-PPE domain-containing protein [Mycobacterium shimoidei]|uniref:PE-PPE domain-containing protein n=1 Tax=Mycobacterium shimoidei TaxID=29313 RepID=UPI0015F0B5BA|nr:PE-PPE domain-containing protein [Mycobacterium shimoidei]MCV7258360.1 PE-PPE domain-containing protein [Mycobacterium shimoidei]
MLTAIIVVAVPMNPGAARASAVTYTVEPFDYDGVNGISMSMTKLQLGGTLCPCVKVPYPADGLHNDAGVAALANTPLHAGDTVLGFSLGSQVISLYLARHTPPPGVRFVLLGDTFARNDQLVAVRQGVPPDIANEVILMAREYDGWSDFPTAMMSPNYPLALQNAQYGAGIIHNYANARLDHPANVVTRRGNITALLIPTQHLPLNTWRRWWGQSAQADQLDALQRPLIDSAYDRPVPTPQQRAAATSEQVANT